MSCDPNLLPELWPMAGEAGTLRCAGSWLLFAIAVALAVWRGVPALIGRHWRPHPDPTHLHPPGQRAADSVLSLGLLVAAAGLVERDWAWQAIGFAAVVSWVLGSILVGVMREREDPTLPETATTVLNPGSEPEGDL